MDASVYVGLVVFALLFVGAGINHIKNHAGTAGYTGSVLPTALQPLAFLGGVPTGIALIAGGVGAAFGQAWALYGLAGFLVLATALFHRDFYKNPDPGGFKTVSLAGAAFALAQLVF